MKVEEFLFFIFQTQPVRFFPCENQTMGISWNSTEKSSEMNQKLNGGEK